MRLPGAKPKPVYAELPEDPIARELALFGRRASDPRAATEGPILPPAQWLADPYHSGDLGDFDPTTGIGCWPSTRDMFVKAAGGDWHEVAVTGAFGTGKAEPLSNVLPTPAGMRRMGDIKVGDEVFGSDGRPTKVTGVFPRGRMQLFEVTFSDKTSVKVSRDHLWAVGAPSRWREGRFQVVPTTDLAGDLRHPSGQRKRFIPMADPLAWPDVELPIDPYVLGVLLADGNLSGTGVRLCCGDEGVPREVERLLSPGLELNRYDCEGRATVWGVVAPQEPGNPIKDALKAMGLWGCRSWERFVPEAYLRASPSQRLALVQGLMDTDGETSTSSMTFGSTSLRLLEGFQFLVQSLGGVARRQKDKRPWYRDVDGRRRDCRTYHRCSVSLPASMCGTRVLADRWPSGQVPSRSIVSIEPAGEDEVACISVAAEDGLYVTEHCIVTHNTAWAVMLLAYWLYELSRYVSPQALVGLQPHSILVFMLTHMNKTKALDKLFNPLRDALGRCPYFTEKFQWDTSADAKKLVFPKNIVVMAGTTDPEAVRAVDLLVSVQDEVNFLPVVAKSARDKEGRGFDAAEAIYQAAKRRMDSRFKGASLWTPKVVLMSSRDRPHDFLERRERDVLTTAEVSGPPEARDLVDVERKLLYFTRALWASRPPGTYSDHKFTVEVGGDGRRSRVLEPGEAPTTGARVVHVPEDFREAFLKNVDEALRELAGIAIAGVGLLFPEPSVIEAGVVAGQHPFSRLTTTLQDGGQLLYDEMFADGAPRCCPRKWRFAHVDVALTQDALGIGIVHAHDVKDVLRPHPADEGRFVRRQAPVYRSDFTQLVVPPVGGGEIRLGPVLQLLLDMRDAGMKIAKVTFDSFQCLAAGTRVHTNRGVLPIEDVQVGDVVPTLSGPNVVTATHTYQDVETLVVRTTDGDVLEGTPNHRIRVSRHDATHEAGGTRTFKSWVPEDRRWEWRRLDQLRRGDIVDMVSGPQPVDCEDAPLQQVHVPKRPKGCKWTNRWRSPERMTPAIGELVGLLWGDRDIDMCHNNHAIRLLATEDEAEDALDAFQAVFGERLRWRPYAHKNCGLIQFGSRRIVDWLRSNDMSKPYTPEVVWRSSRAVRRAYLRGLFAADGSVASTDGYVTFSTKHRRLANEVRLMLRTDFGLESTLTAAQRGHAGDFVSEGEQYIVGVRGSRELFADRVGFTYAKKQKKLETHSAVKGRRIYTRVETVTAGKATTHDITVADDPSYVANGFRSHNSAKPKQDLQDRGIPTDRRSMDRTPEAYLGLRDAYEEGRVQTYDYPPLITELRNLIYFRAQGKVDHAPSGTKDCSDALAGAVANAEAAGKLAWSEAAGAEINAFAFGGSSLSKPGAHGTLRVS